MSPKLFYLLTDHLDSIDTVLDSQGNVLERQDYFSFGSERVTDSTKEAPQTDLGYTGKEKDEETGLNYYGARYYDSGLGRFISVDPWEGELSDPQTLNKFSYVLNNPLKFIDPTGMYEKKSGTVEEGDTLSGINDELNEFYGTSYSVNALAKINGISDPNKIEVGQIIRMGTLDGWTVPNDPDVVDLNYWNNLTNLQQYLLNYSRNFYQPVPPATVGDLDPNEWIISPYSSGTHNVGGVSGNIDYRGIGSRKGQQAVYDKNGNLVMSAENKGTYDFGLANESSLDHKIMDIDPWVKWGNSVYDTTTSSDRASKVGGKALDWAEYFNFL